MNVRFLSLSPLLVVLGCGSPMEGTDAATDVASMDSPTPADTGAPDAGAPDTVVPDAGTDDATAPDDASTAPGGTVLVAAVAPSDIAIGGGFVYYTLLREVWRVPVAGGTPERMYVAGSPSFATSFIDADDSRFAWTERDANSTVRGAVRACSHAGCGAGSPANINFGESTGRIASEVRRSSGPRRAPVRSSA